MSAAQRVRESAGTPEKAGMDWGESMTKLFTTGIGRIAEMEKKSLDIAVQQNGELVDLWKKTMQKMPGMPGLFLLELEGSGFERFAEIEKSAIDLMVEQSKAFADLVKDRGVTMTGAGEEVDAFAKKSLERVIAMQKKALDHSADQTKAVVETSTRQFGENTPIAAGAESVRRGIDAIVDAQKELLDLAVR